MIVNILCIGDVVGKKGRELIESFLPSFIKDNDINFTIVNGENASGGIGLNNNHAHFLLENGADVISSGNHIWKHKNVFEFMNSDSRIIRPGNYPAKVPGRGFTLIEKEGINYLVMNYLGVVYLESVIPPFLHFDSFYNASSHIFEKADCAICDFHAEATGEKKAFGYHLQDRVNLVYGTHTHVQTADEQLLSDKTAYISDIGMTGPYDSVIGMDKDIILDKQINLIPKRYQVAGGRGILSGIIFTFDTEKKKALNIKRINIKDWES